MAKWLVAGEAVYQLIGREGDVFTAVIEAGTTNPKLIGRTVTFTASEIRCGIKSGTLTMTATPPKVGGVKEPTKKKARLL